MTINTKWLKGRVLYFRSLKERSEINGIRQEALTESFGPFQILFSYQLLQNTECTFLWYKFLLVIIYIYIHIYRSFISDIYIIWYMYIYILVCIQRRQWQPNSSTLAWKIPWAEEPGRLQSMGSLRVGHDWTTSLSLFIFMQWRRKWQPTPVFLPGESQGWGSLVGCHLWGHTESDATETT